jgi:hypothetical protein
MTQIVTSYNSGAPLNEYYTHQFVQNETTCTHPGGVNVAAVYPPLEHTPVVAGTLTGTVYVGHTAIQVFVVSSDGVFTFTDIGHSIPIKCQREGSSINLDVGEITLQWTGGDPGPNHFVVSYEYNMEAWGNFTGNEIFATPTFREFFTSEALLALLQTAGTKTSWSWQDALGDTIMEKYESLYVKAIELTNVLVAKGAKGYFWIATSPALASIFQTATSGFQPSAEELGDHKPMGVKLPQYVGLVHSKWRLYSCDEFPQDQLLIGCNDYTNFRKHYGQMTLSGFVL